MNSSRDDTDEEGVLRRVDWPEVVPETLRDESAVRAARGELLGYFALVTGAMGVPFALFFWLAVGSLELATYLLVGGSAMAATVPMLRVTSHLELSANWASLSLLVTLGLVIPPTGGLASPGVGWFAVIPIFTLVFAGKWYGLVWGIVVLGALMGFYWFPGAVGHFEGSIGDLERRRLTVFAVAGLTGLLAGLFLIYRRYMAQVQTIGAQFEEQAERDPLTDLPNRRAFDHELRERLEVADRSDESIAVGVFDLDDFKRINDQWGHPAGDELLCEIGRRLESTLRASDVVARLGGDEFGVIVSGVARPEDLRAVAGRVMGQFGRAFELEQVEGEVHVEGSLGVALRTEEPEYDESAEERLEHFLRTADRAMYEAKDRDQGWRVRELD